MAEISAFLPHLVICLDGVDIEHLSDRKQALPPVR